MIKIYEYFVFLFIVAVFSVGVYYSFSLLDHTDYGTKVELIFNDKGK